MSADINGLALRYVETSSEVMRLATKIAKDSATKQGEATDKVAGVVGHLKKAGLIDEHEQKLATDQLSNPASTLDVLSNVLSEYGKLQAKVASAQLGSADSSSNSSLEQSGSSHFKNANYTGYQRGAGESGERDRALLALIGKD